MDNCPCCSDTLLRQVDRNGIYFFCQHCRQKMPTSQRVIDVKQQSLYQTHSVSNHHFQ
ncbi:MAG: hypothetical protein F6J86_19165 [Symploca sp. SIO1B1]|nr:hypothetical protein [Symploca sp. SIO1C2]NER95932.1 hypothetical protein [Symploca sp. SIO1B1]